jgi:hypothetical protein
MPTATFTSSGSCEKLWFPPPPPPAPPQAAVTASAAATNADLNLICIPP